jgi:hypothetical protein
MPIKPFGVLVQFILALFQQNVREVVHESYQARRGCRITPFVQPFAQV